MELARVPYPTPNFFSPLSMDITVPPPSEFGFARTRCPP